MLHDRDGRITGFQEKPEPDEALSDLGNCGIYMFDPRDLRLLPRRARSSTGPKTSSRRCSRTTCRSTSTSCASTGTTSARWASCARARSTRCSGELHLEMQGEEVRPGVIVAGDSPLREDTEVDGAGVDRARRADRRGRAPDGADRARRRRAASATARSCARASSSRAPSVAAGSILIGAIAGHGGILQSLRRGSA